MDRTRCPYNKNHTFRQQKYFWHISRCKDKLKCEHLFRVCSFNCFHIVPKEDIETHELICDDRDSCLKTRQDLGKIMKKCFEFQQFNCKKQGLIKNQETTTFEDQKKPIISNTELKNEEQIEAKTLIIQNEPNIDQNSLQITIQECKFCEQFLKKFVNGSLKHSKQQALTKQEKISEQIKINKMKKLAKFLKMYKKLKQYQCNF